MSDPEKPNPEVRDAHGRFVPGQSANPGGRSKTQRAVQAILDEAAPDGARELLRLMLKAEKDSDRLSAIKMVLEHVIGKPRERDDEGRPVDAVAQAILELAKKAGGG